MDQIVSIFKSLGTQQMELGQDGNSLELQLGFRGIITLEIKLKKDFI
jgi:hypothetical protein